MNSDGESDSNDVSKNKSKRKNNGFEEWGGYMAAKKNKLQEQFELQKPYEFQFNSSKSNIFSGISIHVNGYTNPSANELRQLMMIHGGTYHHYYSVTNTTYMVATNLPHSKMMKLKDKKVITPNWIIDSIQAGKCLPYNKYALFTPEDLFNQNRLNFDSNESNNNAKTSTEPPCTECKSNESPFTNTSADSQCTDFVSTELLCADYTSTLEEGFVLPHIELKTTSNASSSDSTPKSPASHSSSDKNTTNGAIQAGQPGFISEFYNHSRLHHISTAAQDLKQYVQQLAVLQKGKPFPARDKLVPMKSPVPLLTKKDKVIMHLDMDCFFVSVGLRKYSEFRGQPVAVTHSKGRRVKPQEGNNKPYRNIANLDLSDEDTEGSDFASRASTFGSMSEIACCSYEARDAGLWNGMLLGAALRKCPDLKTIPYDFEAYSEVTKKLYDIVTSYTLDVEAVSCDELFIDCTELLNSTQISPSEFASVLRKEIFQETECTASAGMGSNMLIARCASRVAKPNGQYIVHEDDVSEFMQDQNIKDLPGVGYATRPKLEQLGIVTCLDLQKWPIAKLQKEFGVKKGQTLYEYCRGKDERVVTLEKDRKSVSAEINYGIRFKEEKDIIDFLAELSLEVHRRLKQINKKGRSITLKLMVRRQDAPVETAKFMGHGMCDSLSKSSLLKAATDNCKVIEGEVSTICRTLKIPPQDYRGIGIQVSKLESSEGSSKNGQTLENFLSKPGPSTSIVQSKTILTNDEIVIPTKNVPSNDASVVKNATTLDIFLSKPSSSTSAAQTKNAPTKDKTAVCIKTSGSTSIDSALTLDQLDQSVLNALPPDIQQEIIAVYGNKGNNTVTANNYPVNKKQEVVPVVTKKKNKLSKTNFNSISSYWSKGNSSKNNSQESSSSGMPMLSNCSSYVQATLGGATQIDEVRDMVQEWVSSSQRPATDDVDQFKEYVLKLIEEDLEKTDLIIKYFYRVVNVASELWRDSYLTILSYVQQKMLHKYGYMLKAKSDFS